MHGCNMENLPVGSIRAAKQRDIFRHTRIEKKHDDCEARKPTRRL